MWLPMSSMRPGAMVQPSGSQVCPSADRAAAIALSLRSRCGASVMKAPALLPVHPDGLERFRQLERLAGGEFPGALAQPLIKRVAGSDLRRMGLERLDLGVKCLGDVDEDVR